MKLSYGLLNCVEYAVDTTFYVSGDEFNIICNTINVQLEKINHWLRLNELSLNLDRTHSMIFASKLHIY